jgi:hypothetical protein
MDEEEKPPGEASVPVQFAVEVADLSRLPSPTK